MKTRLFRTMLAATALAVPAFFQAPASADVAVAAGLGIINPGIPATGCVNNAHFEIFNGNAVNSGPTHAAGAYTFTVRGDSATCASVTSDFGVATLQGDVSGTVTYSRTVGLITLNGNASVRGSAPGPITITCEVVIRGVFPITEFAVVCTVQI